MLHRLEMHLVKQISLAQSVRTEAEHRQIFCKNIIQKLTCRLILDLLPLNPMITITVLTFVGVLPDELTRKHHTQLCLQGSSALLACCSKASCLLPITSFPKALQPQGQAGIATALLLSAGSLSWFLFLLLLTRNQIKSSLKEKGHVWAYGLRGHYPLWQGGSYFLDDTN